MKSTIPVTGKLAITLTDSNGNIKSSETHNLVVNVGIAAIANRLISDAEAKITHMALGKGVTAAAAGNTALVTEAGRVAMQTTTQVTESVSNDAVQYVAEFGPGVATGNITEAGLFTAASAGKMWCRSVFSVLGKEAGDTLVIAWVIKVGL